MTRLTPEEHAKLDAIEQRLAAPITREELINAIEKVAHNYACNGTHDADLIANAFRALVEAIE